METVEKAPTITTNCCGTKAGHQAHKRRNEIPCRLCRDAVNEYNAKWRAEHKDVYARYVEKNREKILLRMKVYIQENYEKRVAYREANSEHIKLKRREWQQANPETVRLYNNQRRALRLSVPHEPYTEAQVLEHWGTDCHICHEPVDLSAPRLTGVEGWERGLHLEHVLGLTLGGHDTLENVKPAHGKCNLTKKRKSA